MSTPRDDRSAADRNVTRRRALAMLAAAPLALAALPAVAQAEPAPLAPSAWPEPSPLASAIIGRLLQGFHQFFDDAKAGVPLEEASARLEARGGVIYDELVDGRGPEAHAAWVDALERIQYVLAVFSEHFGHAAA